MAEPSASIPFIVRGTAIREDASGRICLDDIWTVAEASPARDPRRWRVLPGTKRLIEQLQKNVAASAFIARTAIVPVIDAQIANGNTSTFAHPTLAAAYAGYLSPRLEIEIREVWLRYRQGDTTLADEILQRASPEDNRWAAVRAMGRAKRVAFTDTLRAHGVRGPGYPLCTNAVYRQVLGGTAADIRARLGLQPRANVREYLGTSELSYVMAAEALAADRIEDEASNGNDECERASSRSASFIRQAIERDKQDRRKRIA